MTKILIVFALVANLFAHSGRTDSSGGHNNKKTGSYHYHGGYSKPKVKKITSDTYECGKKRYCYEMSSCSEVMYYFNTCSLYRLDGDKDGIPCEKLCN
jgi:hypothetical protein